MDSLVREDLEYIWHPCMQMHDFEKNVPLVPIKSASGVYLYGYNGEKYIDCISSWWVNIFGHCNPYINQKLKEQVDKLEHVIFATFTHEPIITLSKRLIKLTNYSFDKCFYADNGSSVIEVALKMAFAAKRFEDKNVNSFISLQNAYHGETIGALSIGDIGIYNESYKPLLCKSIKIKAPRGDFYLESLEELENTLKENKDKIAAFVLEPLIQCAGGMNMYNAEFVKEATNLCRKYGIYVIFDEIAVGFGRTGSMFAFEQCGVTPDFLCLSKGISGGYLPLSVVLLKNEVYNIFYAPFYENKAFLHSHSYTGNALACACANATLDIFEKDNVIVANKILSDFIWEKAQKLLEFNFIQNLRRCGMVLAFDIVGFVNERKGLEVFNKGLKKGLLLRPLGNTIYFMPPYVITKDEVLFVFDNLKCIFETFQ